MTVQSDAIVHSTSRWKLPRRASSEKLITARAPTFFAGGVDDGKSQGAEAEEHGGGPIGGGIVEVFDLIVKDDGKRARSAGNVAAEHEDDSKFADSVEKTEYDGSKQRAARERNQDAGDEAHRSGAEKTRGIDKSGVDRSKSGDERLHGEGKAVDDRSDDEAIEGKCERVAEQGGDAATKGGARTEQDEKKKAEHGRRQDHGQGGECLDRGEPSAPAQHNERRERHGDSEKNRGGEGGETK